MRKKYRKSTWMGLALVGYISGTAYLLLPKNGEMSSTEKWWTVIGGYVIVLILWIVLRKKENLVRKREEEMK